MMKRCISSRQAAGITLLESLIAIAVLTAGLLAILVTHTRTLMHAQESVRRQHATRLMEDLAERLRILPDARSTAAWFLTHGWTESDLRPSPPDCRTTACTAAGLAQHGREQWLKNVSASLPLGQANIFSTPSPYQLGVMLAWRTTAPLGSDTVSPPPVVADSSAIHCPAQRTCHLQYIHLGQRCISLEGDNLHCPGS